jgi:AraC-like DNA-binding protein
LKSLNEFIIVNFFSLKVSFLFSLSFLVRLFRSPFIAQVAALQHHLALAKLLSVRHGTPLPLSAQVRHLLRPLLLTGHMRMADVAERLGMHPRTMRRRLRAEGTTFEAIRNEVRQVAARELLRLGDLSIADISATLDYSTPSSFVHAFRRWCGTSPGLWRTAA